MRSLFRAVAIATIALAVAAPSAVGATRTPPSVQEPAPGALSYHVGPQDVLDVAVWEHPELGGKFTVGNDGAITFPLIGAVQASGRTIEQIQADLTNRLKDGFLKAPQVSVNVQQYASQKVFVMGEVHTPGPLPLTGAITLIEALARAGSLTEQAGGEIVVLRSTDLSVRAPDGPVAPGQTGTSEVARVDVQQLRRGAPVANIQLRTGDSIFVPRAASIFVLGLVNNPGSYTLEVGLTVLKAISLAGGTSALGSTGRVRILRVVKGQNTEIKATLDDVLQPGDTVVVRARVF